MRRNPFSWDCVRTRRIRPLPPSPRNDNTNNTPTQQQQQSAADDTKSGAASRHALPLLDGTQATPVHLPATCPAHEARPKASKFSSTAHR